MSQLSHDEASRSVNEGAGTIKQVHDIDIGDRDRDIEIIYLGGWQRRGRCDRVTTCSYIIWMILTRITDHRV